MKLKGLLIMLALMPIITLAQPKGQRNQGTPEENAQKITERMNEKLSLSEDQYQAVLDLNLDMTEQMKVTFEETEQVRAEMRSKMMEIHEDRDAMLKEVLNKEQWEQFIALKEEEKKRMRERRRGE